METPHDEKMDETDEIDEMNENDRWVAAWNEWRADADDAYETAFERLEGESPELGVQMLIELEEGEPKR